MIKPYLYLEDTSKKGRGVFSQKKIEAETLLEESPVIVMSATERTYLDKTKLHDYIFEWEGVKDENGAIGCCVGLGYISMYNHSYTSNCEYYMDYEKEFMQIKSVRDIEIGEELTINYNGDWDDSKKLWFDAEE
jgi:hypothetical protein